MTNPNPTNPPTSWTVIAQMPTSQAGPGGQYAQGKLVTFRTGAGNVDSVFIPNSQYTLDRVRAEVAEKAALLDAVGGLSSQA